MVLKHVSLKWCCFVFSWDYCFLPDLPEKASLWNVSPFSISFCRNYRLLFLLSSALCHPVFSLSLLPYHVLAKVCSSHCGMGAGLGGGGGGGLYGLFWEPSFTPPHSLPVQCPVHHKNVYGLCWDNSELFTYSRPVTQLGLLHSLVDLIMVAI